MTDFILKKLQRIESCDNPLKKLSPCIGTNHGKIVARHAGKFDLILQDCRMKGMRSRHSVLKSSAGTMHTSSFGHSPRERQKHETLA